MDLLTPTHPYIYMESRRKKNRSQKGKIKELEEKEKIKNGIERNKENLKK